jgi:hypothetical protein
MSVSGLRWWDAREEAAALLNIQRSRIFVTLVGDSAGACDERRR